jgi:hypothetical protein
MININIVEKLRMEMFLSFLLFWQNLGKVANAPSLNPVETKHQGEILIWSFARIQRF